MFAVFPRIKACLLYWFGPMSGEVMFGNLEDSVPTLGKAWITLDTGLVFSVGLLLCGTNPQSRVTPA